MQKSIRRRSIFEETRCNINQRLYNPLRKALRQLSQNKANEGKQTRSSSLHILKSSEVSKSQKELKPEQAYKLGESILIPTVDPLVPTNKIEKVKSKKFVAIKTNIKQCKPITEQELKSRLTRKEEQIVYQIQGQSDEYGYLETPSRIKQNSIEEMSIKLKKERFQKPKSCIPSLEHEYGLKKINPSYFKDTKRDSQSFIEESFFPEKQKHSNGKWNTSFSNKKEQSKIRQASTMLKEQSRFNLSQKSEGDRYIPKIISISKQKNSRYNIFSSLDYAINNKTLGCGGLELVASKQTYPWS